MFKAVILWEQILYSVECVHPKTHAYTRYKHSRARMITICLFEALRPVPWLVVQRIRDWDIAWVHFVGLLPGLRLLLGDELGDTVVPKIVIQGQVDLLCVIVDGRHSRDRCL